MITFWGAVIALIFCVCYIGQSISSGMQLSRGRILQWGCWLLANGTMFLVYFLTDAQGG